MYCFRLDDASERMDVRKWSRIELLFDKYNIKPLVGVIPFCKDPMMSGYPVDNSFWDKALNWQKKGWIIALHGYEHIYTTNDGGVNPVHCRSEFAGEAFDVQANKIEKGFVFLKQKGLSPCVFFAPSHTFDKNTVKALLSCTSIRHISDTIAYDSYKKEGIIFIPQQTGSAKHLPFKLVTFCYHPNTMKEIDFIKLEKFIKKNRKRINNFKLIETERHYSILDAFLSFLYMRLHK